MLFHARQEPATNRSANIFKSSSLTSETAQTDRSRLVLSPSNEFRAIFARSVIAVGGTVRKIAQTLATSCACSGEVGQENIAVLA